MILNSDVKHIPLQDETVDLIVTSPPYLGLRSYDETTADSTIGYKETLNEYLESLYESMEEMVRVLKPTGSIFVNLDDTYSTHDNPYGAAKSMLGVPQRFMIQTMDRNRLICRSEIVWVKRNALPEACTDRVRRRNEKWFHFVKQQKYFSAVKLASGVNSDGSLKRLLSNVWDDIPMRYLQKLGGENHPAPFPYDLVYRIIKGWCPPKVCTECSTPFKTRIRREVSGEHPVSGSKAEKYFGERYQNERDGGYKTSTMGKTIKHFFEGWEPDCTCDSGITAGVVLDPFSGSGTTGLVAETLGYKWFACDISMKYCKMSNIRIFDETQQKQVEQLENCENQLRLL